MRVALNTPATLTIEVRNYDGTLVAPTGSVAITVTDMDGDTAATGTATATGTTGVYTYALPTVVTGALGDYEVEATWTVSGATTTKAYTVDVVKEHLFEVHEMRDFDPAFVDANRYTAEEIRVARDRATDRLERAAGVAFTTRAKLITLSGDGTSRLLLPDRLVSAVTYAEVAGTVVSGNDLELLPHGVLVHTSDVWPADGPNNVVVGYEYGYQVVPAEVRKAAMIVAREHLVQSATPARATSQSTDLGEFRISVANLELGRPTGIPDVDTVVALYGVRTPAVG